MTVSGPLIEITSAAAAKIVEIAAKELKTGQFFRIGVAGGGCSGLTYTFSFSERQENGDLLIEAHGASALVDPKSLKLLKNSVLDWEDTLMRKGFVWKNPNQTGSCSCGESFSA